MRWITKCLLLGQHFRTWKTESQQKSVLFYNQFNKTLFCPSIDTLAHALLIWRYVCLKCHPPLKISLSLWVITYIKHMVKTYRFVGACEIVLKLFPHKSFLKNPLIKNDYLTPLILVLFFVPQTTVSAWSMLCYFSFQKGFSHLKQDS